MRGHRQGGWGGVGSLPLTGVGERRLVDVEEGVAHREVREYHEVDLSHQPAFRLRVSGLVDLLRRVEQRHRDIQVAARETLWLGRGARLLVYNDHRLYLRILSRGVDGTPLREARNVLVNHISNSLDSV